MNDHEDLLLEHGVSMLQTLPSNSGLSHAISDGFIGVGQRQSCDLIILSHMRLS